MDLSHLLNRSAPMYKPSRFLASMMAFDVMDATKPVLIAFTGLMTLTVVLLGYLYIQRRALRDAAHQRVIDSVIQDQQELLEQEEEEEGGEDIEVIERKWPVDQQCMVQNAELSDKEIDALKYCGHIPSQVKKAKVKATQKKIEQEMTDEQKERERDLQREQLHAIFKLMEEQKEKFGVGSLDDVDEQMRLYM